MSETMHITQRFDTTRTLCDEAAGPVAAINYSDYAFARGPFCDICEAAAKAGYLEEEVEDLREYMATRYQTDFGAPAGALAAAVEHAKAKRRALGYGSVTVMAADIIRSAAVERPPDV